MQAILTGTEKLGAILRELGLKRLFVVHGSAYSLLRDQIEAMCFCVNFSGFSPNAQYDDVIMAARAFRGGRCDGILAVGGGTAMDIAKCTKLFHALVPDAYLDEKQYHDTGIPLIAVPTTAGTGSESTHFAVLYKDGTKQSIAHASLLPSHVVLDERLLSSLPPYQRKCAFLDALCQAIESCWSAGATKESRIWSHTAMRLLRSAQEDYFAGDATAASVALLGANYAGRAIDIARTNAPHALSYGLTSRYGLPHGHAVALCLPRVWEAMLCHGRLAPLYDAIAASLGFSHGHSAIQGLDEMLAEMQIFLPKQPLDIDWLVGTVNAQRLGNSPVPFDEASIRRIYLSVAGGTCDARSGF